MRFVFIFSFSQTECSFLSIMSLAHYGNWCGMGNNGKDPEDEIDACCQSHDHCYDTVMTSGDCHLPHPLLVTYSWSPVNGDNSTLICDDCSGDRSIFFLRSLDKLKTTFLTVVPDRPRRRMRVRLARASPACVTCSWPVVCRRRINVHLPCLDC